MVIFRVFFYKFGSLIFAPTEIFHVVFINDTWSPYKNINYLFVRLYFLGYNILLGILTPLFILP